MERNTIKPSSPHSKLSQSSHNPFYFFSISILVFSDHMASFSSSQATIATIEITIYTSATSTVSITENPAVRQRRRPVVSKPERPLWVTLVRIFSKNLVLLILILGLIQMIRKLALKSADSSRGSVLDFERRIAEVESFLKITKDMMEVQADFVNRFEKLSEMLEREVSLDEIRMTDRDMVEKEIQRHAADGLGRIDYALSSGGAMVVRHSEPFFIGMVGLLFRKFGLTTVYRDSEMVRLLFRKIGLSLVNRDSEKMLKPSFGEPGQCFTMKGDSGFVEIRLRTTIIPEAITLEHVEKVMFLLFYVIYCLLL